MKEITCFSVREWRRWLERNHRKEDKVFLIRYKKHTGKKSFNQGDAMNEAICFGWIDTTLRRVDDERYGVTFVKRKKSSKWSDNTFARARKMIELGKMSDFGMEMFELGLTKKTHDHGIPKNPSLEDIPELKNALSKDKKASKAFENLAPSYKRTYFRWILSGKRDETRLKRIRETVNNVKNGKMLGVSDKDV